MKRYQIESIPQQESAPQENTLQLVGRNVARAGADVASSLGGIPHSIDQLVKLGKGAVGGGYEESPYPSRENIKSFIEEKTEPYTGAGYLRPQDNWGEKAWDRFAGFIPYIAMGGSSIPTRLATAAAGTLGGEAARRAGLGEWGQAGGEIAGTLGIDLARGAKGLHNIAKAATALRKSSYDEAQKIAPGLIYPTEPIKEKIRGLVSGATPGLSRSSGEKVKTEVNHILKTLSGNSQYPTVNDIWNAKKGVNELLSKGKTFTENKTIEKIFKDINGQLLDELHGPIAKDFPDFYKAFNTGETLHKAENIRSVIDKVAGTGKYQKVIKSLSNPAAILLGVPFLGPKGAAIVGATSAGIKGIDKARSFNKMMEIPEIAERLRKLGDDILQGKPSLISSKIKEFDDFIRKNVPGAEEQPKGRYVIQ